MNALVAAAWVISQVPWTLSSITVRKPFGVIASAGLEELAAGVVDEHVEPAVALEQRRRTSASTASSSRMSSGSRSALPASLADQPAPSRASGSGRRPQPTTVAPSRGELERGRPAEPGARPGDDADLAVEQPGRKTCETAGHGQPSAAGHA